MNLPTKTKKTMLINFGEYEAGVEADARAQSLADDIYDLSRRLFAYTFPLRYTTRREMTNDELMMEFDISDFILNYEIDEVWVFGCREHGIAMGGTKGFWLGTKPVTSFENIHRRFAFMRFNDELPIKTYARRIENTMYYVYRGYPPKKNMWERFIRNDRATPEHASCGTVLIPPNGVLEGYDAKKDFLSDADDWLNNYPDLRDRARFMNSDEWGRTQEGYLKWWMRHLPHGLHKLDGIHENWWYYVMNLDLVK